MSKAIQISNVVADLDRDHANMAKLLDLLESEILAIEVGKTPNFALLRNIMRYMVEHPDRYHHPREDLLFAQLAERHPEYRADFDRVKTEHAALAEAARSLRELLARPTSDSVEFRERISNAAHTYAHDLREHMAREEQVLFPAAISLLKEDDWRSIEERFAAADDPVFDEMTDGDYQLLYRRIVEYQLVAGPERQ